jgi:hypothetical protein
MMIARWSIDARFGHKQQVIALMQRWLSEIAPQIGFSADRTRLLTGSVGALESTVQTEHQIRDLTELDEIWKALADIPAHQQWGRELEPLVVSGTNRWEVFRVL